jgi:hypothetical protein
VTLARRLARNWITKTEINRLAANFAEAVAVS